MHNKYSWRRFLGLLNFHFSYNIYLNSKRFNLYFSFHLLSTKSRLNLACRASNKIIRLSFLPYTLLEREKTSMYILKVTNSTIACVQTRGCNLQERWKEQRENWKEALLVHTFLMRIKQVVRGKRARRKKKPGYCFAVKINFHLNSGSG